MEQVMIAVAERSDRKLDAARIRRLRQSYTVFARAGLNDAEIKSVLAITDYEMQQVLRD